MTTSPFVLLFTYKSKTIHDAPIHLPTYIFPSMKLTVCCLGITSAAVIITYFTDPYVTRVLWLNVGSVILGQKTSNNI